MGSRGQRQFIRPAWTHTVGALLDEGAVVRVICGTCSRERMANLQRIADAKGRDFSLYDRAPRCWVQGCPGRLFFSAARPDAGTRPTNLRGGLG